MTQPVADTARISSIPDDLGRCALHYAAGCADIRKCGLLIRGGADANCADTDGRTPLHLAVESGSLETVQALLDAGAFVDAMDNAGNTPLMLAAFECYGDGGVIRALLSYGANPNRKNKSGVTPFSLARMISSLDVTRFFVGEAANSLELDDRM